MKRFMKLIVIGIFVLILFAIPTALDQANANSTETIWVLPSGDLSGETDWANIMAAFEQAVASGAGSMVHLGKGDFFVHRPIQVANFSGIVKGEGKDLTRMHTSPNSLFGLMEYPLPPVPTFMVFYLDENWPMDIIADITLSDLSIFVDGPSEPWRGGVLNSMLVVSVNGITRGYLDPNHANFELSHINAEFKHLKIVADTGTQYNFVGTSILADISIFGEVVIQPLPGGNFLSRWEKPVTGTFTFEDIEMYDSLIGLQVSSLKDSVLQIGGGPDKKIVSRGSLISSYIADISNSIVEVSYLDVSGGQGGVFLAQGVFAAWGNDLGELVPESLPEPSSFVIHHNNIYTEFGESAAIELWNPGGEVGQSFGNVVISNNMIYVANHTPPFEGILSYLVDNVQVTNNRIAGSGFGGIWVEPFGTPGTNWLLQGNNLNSFSADKAPLVLGSGTSKVTVIGGNTLQNVLDLGTDNILVGVNNMGGNSQGLNLKDALDQKREVIMGLP